MSQLDQILASPLLKGWSLGPELGRGGMGLVHLVTEARSGARRALKILSPAVAAEKDCGLRFQREVGNMVALRHPNLVRAYTAGEYEGIAFLIMEYCEGGSVADLIARSGPLPVRVALHMIRDVLDGLAYAHGASVVSMTGDAAPVSMGGIVHRDLKPHNVLTTTESGTRLFKIADFGLAKAFELAGVSAVTYTGAMGGTPAFMPRQQAVNFKYARPEVDVWAAAACFYYALTGRPPRDLVLDRDPWLQVWTTTAMPIAERGISLPAALSRLIDESLVDRPEIRFSTVADFANALTSACRREGIEYP